ncbi:hypothetical protein LTR04_000221 [Oleoguttula sp. CCFEE 6159]|nr:hypothetical protein LTR04_000221 [Oleoguttula sp. CCFEE 6159]
MTDIPSSSRGATPNPPSAIPQALAEPHIPAVSSPLNPDTSVLATAARPRPTKAPAREQREKRDTIKKRESTAKNGTPDRVADRKGAATRGVPSPMRYAIPPPRTSDYDPPRPPLFLSHEPNPFVTPDGEVELKRPVDHAVNKKDYRYTPCVADPQFRHKQYYRQSDGRPYGARMSLEDADKWMHFAPSGLLVTNEKGWRMARANVCAREGSLYYEVRIVKGVPMKGTALNGDDGGPMPHIRMGWARREAPLDAPVGFDGYSYGVTDVRFETMHRSRANRFYHPKPKKSAKSKAAQADDRNYVTHSDADCDVRTGDVIGLEITLPALSLQKKIVDGIYNPAVDIGDGFEQRDPHAELATLDIVRDRIPVPYKGNVYFETFEYQATKPMDLYADRSLSATSAATTPDLKNKLTPNPNHAEPPLRSLPHSAVRVWRNGILVGTAFENLLAFLPPASAPAAANGARPGFDDGALGYYPAVASFSGGIAELNFGDGPDGFWFPPPHLAATAKDYRNDIVMHDANGLTNGSNGGVGGQSAVAGMMQNHRQLRPIGARYKEQIAEDVLWDIIDECDFFVQDGGFAAEAEGGEGEIAASVVKSEALARARGTLGEEGMLGEEVSRRY